jgi:hypothetical protein
VPTQPVAGAPGDSLRLIAQGVSADVGAKSPLLPVSQDSVLARLAVLPVGSTDTVRLDVTDLVRSWTIDTLRPRALMVRAVPEGGTYPALAFASTRSAAGGPSLHLTFVPPITLGGR